MIGQLLYNNFGLSSNINGSPSELVATVLSDTSIKLDWTIGSTNHDGHKIMYSLLPNSNFVLLDTVLGSTSSYSVTGLTANTKYYFYVVAFKGNLFSNPSTTINSYTFTTEAQAIFAKSVELSETPNYLTKIAVDNAIKSLISNSLWNDEDSIQVYRSWAENSSLINWKTALVQASKQKGAGDYPIFTANKYWETDGSQNYINTGYNLSTGTNFTLNDAGIIYKTPNTLGAGGYAFGGYASSTSKTYLIRGAIGSHANAGMSSAGHTLPDIANSDSVKDGYWGLSRKSSAYIDAMKDSGISENVADTTTALVNKTCTIGKANGLTLFAIEKPELIIFRKQFTQAQFLQLQEIFNNYFYELDIALAEDVKLHGAVGDGITDDFTAITNALSTYNSIKIGSSRSDVFLMSKEFVIPSNKTVVFDGRFKIKNGTITNITQDVAIGSKDFYVTSTTGYNVGELVGWYDDNSANQGGGVQTRKVGGCGYITAVDSVNNIVTVDYGAKWAITASANARFGHYQNVIKIAPATKNVHIYGDGVIDGNMSTQIDIDGVYNDALSGEYGGSGVFVRQCTNISIKGRTQFEATNCILHGISFFGSTTYQSKYINMDKVKCHLNHDKNTLFYNTDTTTITNYVGDDSLFEDGLIFYAINSNVTMSNISCSNNRRAGVNANSNSNMNLVADTVYLSGNKMYDLVSNSNNTSFTNVTIAGVANVSPRYSVYMSSTYEYGDNVGITNLSINGIINPTYGVVGLVGQINDIAINNLVMSGCSGVGILSTNGSLGGYPQSVVFTGGGIYNHTGTKTDIQGTSDVTFTDFDGI